jgi:hypothetical protein
LFLLILPENVYFSRKMELSHFATIFRNALFRDDFRVCVPKRKHKNIGIDVNFDSKSKSFFSILPKNEYFLKKKME